MPNEVIFSRRSSPAKRRILEEGLGRLRGSGRVIEAKIEPGNDYSA